MNQAYKLVWSAAQQAWVVASELAKGHKKSTTKTIKALLLTAIGVCSSTALWAAPAVNALPTGESVVSGTATFDRSISNQLTVNQTTGKLITNWSSFDIGANSTVQFVQPSASSIALNRITAASATEVFGKLNANGQLILVNPNGITFGAGSQVNVAALTASVFTLTDARFNNGVYRYVRGLASTGSVENNGTIHATAGDVSLLSSVIKNNGTIQASAGNVNLVDGIDITLANTVTPLVNVASTKVGVIQNSGTLQAVKVSSAGGRILLVGNTSQADSRVDLSGALLADDTSSVTGKTLNVTGNLLSSGNTTLTAADNIHINAVLDIGTNKTLNLNHGSDAGESYTLSKAAKVNLNGSGAGFNVNGEAYTVLHDVNQLQAVYNADRYTAIYYVLGTDIDATDTVNWNAGEGFNPIGSDYPQNSFFGTFDGLGHSIDGLYINRPGMGTVGLFGKVEDSTIQNIKLSNANITGGNYTGGLIGQIYSSYGAAANVLNNHVHGNITGTSYYTGGLIGHNNAYYGSTTTVRGNSTDGTVEGQTYSVGGLIGNNYAYGADAITQVSNNSSTANVTGLGSGANTGGLIGDSVAAFGGTHLLSDSYATGNVTSNGYGYAGGLVGRQFATNAGSVNTVRIERSYATGNVHSTSSNAGGLVGRNYASGENGTHIGGIASINQSYATGEVSGEGANQYLGGLVGENYTDQGGQASISNSYATGSVIADSTGVGGEYGFVAGLVGQNYATSNGVNTISNSYASGAVSNLTDPYYSAGLVHSNIASSDSTATIEHSYWDTDTTGQINGIRYNSTGSGITSVIINPVSGNGGTDPSAYAKDSYADLDFDNEWFIAEGRSRPMLRGFLNTADSHGNIAVSNLYQLQGMAANLAGHYVLANDIDAAATAASVAAGQSGNHADVWGGKGFAPVGTDPCACASDAFNGTLNGAGYAISNLTIERPTEDAIGLFGGVGSGDIRNLTLDNVSIVGGAAVGGLAGSAALYGANLNIHNVSVSGSIVGDIYAGGLLGTSDVSDGQLTIDSTQVSGSVGANLIVGGLIGQSWVIDTDAQTSISNSSNSASVSGDYGVGGLIGFNLTSISDDFKAGTTALTSISNSSNSGSITAGQSAGGLIGYSQIGGGSDQNAALVIDASSNTGLVTDGGNNGNSFGGLMGENHVFGDNSYSHISNSYSSGDVSAGADAGGLIGVNDVQDGDNVSALIENSYVTGNVSAEFGGAAGGLIGYNWVQDGLNAKTEIRNSYTSGNVSSALDAGGLVGYNHVQATDGQSIIKNAYSSGDVTGAYDAGGIIGYNETASASSLSTIEQSYATGAISELTGGPCACGPAVLGGLVGVNDDVDGSSLIKNSFWNVDSTGQANAAGELNSGVLDNATGLTASQMLNLSSYASWGSDIDAQGGTGSVWRIYDGYSGPLLRSFLTGVTATVGSSTKTYDATSFSGGSYTLSDPSVILDGTAAFAGTSQGARNAGSYNIDLTGLYSGQQGYDLTVVQGSLTINKANLVIGTGNVTKTYDSTTSAAGSAIAVAGSQLFGTDSLSGGTFTFDNKNAGTGKTVTVAAVTVSDGNAGGNYNISYQDNTASTINKAALVLQNSAVNRVYNGTKSANSIISIASGSLFGSDNFMGGKFEFLDKNVGTNKALVMTENIVLNDGNGGNNYLVAFLPSVTNSITPATLTLSAVTSTKVYDGTTASAGVPVITGRKTGDSITNLAQVFADKNVGSGKIINIKSGYVINDGNGGNNYIVNLQSSTAGVITPATLNLTAAADSKVYDGNLSSAAAVLISGLASSDSIGNLTQTFTDRNAGTGKTLNVQLGYVINDGNSGNNYVVNRIASTLGVITPKQLMLTAVANSKAYDGGVTSANKPTVTGLVAGTTDRVTGLFQQYEDKFIGVNKRLYVKSGYVVDDGNSGHNYSVTTQDNMQGVIY